MFIIKRQIDVQKAGFNATVNNVLSVEFKESMQSHQTVY